MNAVAVSANAFAYVALFGWPLVAAILFARMPLERAAAWSLIGGYLLLPSHLEINPPYFPPIDKSSVTVASTLLLCFARGGLPRRRRGGVLVAAFAAVYILAPFAATLNNSYELRIGSLSLPGYYPLDGIKGSINNLIQVSAFYLGLRFLSSPTGRREVLKVFLSAMLAYSVPMLVEIRLSPQLHGWVYGYTPYSFFDQMRWGGFRPAVFLPQGLQLALFVSMALIGACFLARAKIGVLRLPAWLPPLYLSPILVLCKTLGAVVYAIALAPLAIFARPSACLKVACALMLFVCAYPALRTGGLTPIDAVLSASQSVSKDRANSFLTRIRNEDRLLAKANQKPFFGWGEWGRNRVYDPNSGQDISITDGAWIIYFGIFGWFGYLGLFGMLTVPVFRLHGFVKHADREEALVAAGLGLMLAANVADLVPNANLTPITWIIAGSIALRGAYAPARGRSSADDDASRSGVRQLSPAGPAPAWATPDTTTVMS